MTSAARQLFKSLTFSTRRLTISSLCASRTTTTSTAVPLLNCHQNPSLVSSPSYTPCRTAASSAKCVDEDVTTNQRIYLHNIINVIPSRLESTLLLIQHIFDLPDSKKCLFFLQKYPQLQLTDPQEIKNTYNFLLQNGVTSDRIQKMPWLLSADSRSLEEKAQNVMKRLQIQEFRCVVPFIQLPPRRLSRIASLWNHEILHLEEQDFIASETKEKIYNNRIELIAAWLQCETYEVADMMMKTPLLTSAPLQNIEAKIVAMLDHGVLSQDLIKDPFIFTNTVGGIEAKLAKCKHHGLTVIKPWMLRCTPQAFNGYVQRMHEEQQLLEGHKDTESFLAQHLGCSLSGAREILLRVPSVRSASAIKLNEMIQFLLTQGFTRDHILEAPRILGHSVETVEKRIDELGSYGFTPNSLFVLCYTSTHYNSFVRKLRKETMENDK